MEPLDVSVHVAKVALTAPGKDIAKDIDQIFVGNCLPSSFEAGSVTGRQIGLKLGRDVFSISWTSSLRNPAYHLKVHRCVFF
ncbi:MAG TPA: hypothetical protein ENF36_04700 [Desulfobacteraceae bacterium]|nr:hypothetical protein [Desulfobacteraceae bacterium]